MVYEAQNSFAFVCVCVSTCTCLAHMQRSEVNFQQLVPSFYYMGFRIITSLATKALTTEHLSDLDL